MTFGINRHRISRLAAAWKPDLAVGEGAGIVTSASN